MSLITIFHCLFGLVLIALATTLVLRRYGSWTSSDRLMAYAIGLCAAPTIAGLSLMPFFLAGIFPQWAPLVVLVLSVVVIGRTGVRLIMEDGRHLRAAMQANHPLFGLLLAILIVTLSMLLISMPVIENDALEYAALAKFLIQKGNLQQFPLVQADAATGLYAPAMHPPVFHLMLVWSRAWTGATDFVTSSMLGQRLLCVWSFFGTSLTVFAIGLRLGRGQAFFSLLLLLCIPFFLTSVIAYGIDSPRIALFTAASGAVMVALDRADRRSFVIAGVVSGLAMWVHSIGFLVPYLGALTIIMLFAGQHRWGVVIAYAAVSALVGGAWYLRNTLLNGVPLSDTWPASTWPNLLFETDVAMRRGLNTPSDMLLSGSLRPWTEPALFGLVFWIGLLSVNGMRTVQPSNVLRICLLWVGGFLALSIVTALGGNALVIKNPRYWLTLAPLAAVCAGHVLARLWSSGHALRIFVVALMGLSGAWSAASLAIRMVGLAHPFHALMGNERAFLERPRFTGGPLLMIPKSNARERVLSFRPPDTAIYGSTAWLDHFDPALQSLHSATVEQAFEQLRLQKVRWAYLPDYSPVTHANSTLAGLLADQRFATPVVANRNARLFEIHATPRNDECRPLSVQPFIEASSRHTDIGDILAKYTGIPHLSGIFQPETEREVDNKIIWSGTQKSSLSIIGVSLTGRFAVALQLKGSGIVVIDAEFYHPVEGLTSVRLVDGLVGNTPRQLKAQWRTPDGARLTGFKISPLAPAKGEIDIVSVEICQIVE